MSKHGQEGPLDRVHPLNPSRLEQPKDKPAKSDLTEVRRPEVGTCEQDVRQIMTHWQRIKKHPAFKAVLSVGGFGAICGVTVLTLKLHEGTGYLSDTVLEKAPEITEAAFDGIRGEAIRKTPSEHLVSGHQRSQHYGPGRTETKTVQISPHSRGGTT